MVILGEFHAFDLGEGHGIVHRPFPKFGIHLLDVLAELEGEFKKCCSYENIVFAVFCVREVFDAILIFIFFLVLVIIIFFFGRILRKEVFFVFGIVWVEVFHNSPARIRT